MTNLTLSSRSAAHIEVPDQAIADEATMTFLKLCELRDACAGSNRHDQATVLISAIIEEGLDTRSQIIGMLVKLGYNHAHAAIMLKDGIGTRWRHNGVGFYDPTV